MLSIIHNMYVVTIYMNRSIHRRGHGQDKCTFIPIVQAFLENYFRKHILL